MMIEMPLPTPRFVISSPIHMSSVQPAVSVTTISTMRPEFVSSTLPLVVEVDDERVNRST